MYEFVHTDKKAPDGTGYNDFPKGWRKITQEEFVKGPFFSYNPTMAEFRQMYDKTQENWHYKPALQAGLYWFHDGTGVAMETDYWKGTITYYAFGCEHEYVHTAKLGRCYNEYKCSKCDHIQRIDSSD